MNCNHVVKLCGMVNKRYRLLSGLIASGTLWGSAAAEDVQTAIEAALAHDPRAELAAAATDTARSDVVSQLSGFLPTVEGTVSYTDDNLRSASLDTLQERDGTTLGVTVSQPVFQTFTSVNRYRAAKRTVSRQEFLETNTRNQIALSAARAHAGTVFYREITRSRNDNIKLLSRQHEIARRRMEAGAQSITGVEQARMRRDQAMVDLELTRASLIANEAAYARIIGHPPPENLTVDDGKFLDGFDALETAIGAGMHNSPALNAARNGADAARLGVAAAKGDFGPKVFVEGSYLNRLRQQPGLVQEDEYQVVARLRLPIFSGGRNIGGYRRASAQYARSKAEYLNANLALREVIERTWRQMQAAKARSMIAERAINAAERAVEGLQMEYEAGQRNVIDVLDGQRDLLNAQIGRAQANHDYRLAGYELLATIGVFADVNSAVESPRGNDADAETGVGDVYSSFEEPAEGL